ncbi:tRNA pseudouridine(13) synthase TruD [Candidatus Poribacteria bacterium]|nr:tRNA pseudouridine(13) synthase TruD [Candidatus Poribacteria bacterium]MYF55640.1 tRNA pseudouridine(13) synthase TruD [Candidatus Poribacteria bacterium]
MRFEPEDFIVEEIPLYEPSRSGTHTFFAIRKRSLTTYEAINRIARELHVNHKSIGYAGLKDKHAITTQVLSVEGIPPEQILKLKVPQIQILWAERHSHKLRVGHLKANRFEITLRYTSPHTLLDVEKKMVQLSTASVPNRYGEQRFGNKQDSHLIGKALLNKDWERALEYVLDTETAQFTDLAKQIKGMRKHDTLEKVVACIPHRKRRLYLSAYQAYLFNRILEKRLPDLGQLLDGDIAIKHRNGAPFLVENAEIEQPRADAFEISPSGPIFGYKMRQPTGKVLEMEQELLSAEGVKPESFRKVAGVRLPGTRRPLRIQMDLHQVKAVDNGVRLSFTLPAGSYATVVLEELRYC